MYRTSERFCYQVGVIFWITALTWALIEKANVKTNVNHSIGHSTYGFSRKRVKFNLGVSQAFRSNHDVVPNKHNKLVQHHVDVSP
jgi:hypothetical protein